MTEIRTADDAPAVILVVDDNDANRYIIGSWLSRAGHTMVEAADGAQGLAALEAAAAGPPELAIVDVRLPDMSGYEVCERIKADPRTAGMPVVHVSATAIATADRTQGLHRGADAYLTEPIAPSELLATVTAVLRYARARARAERLAERLAVLNEATLEIYSAAGEEQLAAAAARGASSLMRCAAVVLTRPGGPDGVRMTVSVPGAPAESGLIDGAATVEALADAVLGAGVGVEIARVPREVWAALPGPGALGADPAWVVARTKRGRPAVCIAVDGATAGLPEERRLATQLAQACALALEALRSYSEEHSLALTLQRTFLPERLPEVAGVDLAVRYLPASAQNEIGGDFYEAVETPAGLLLAVGDVAGHSLEAAIVMGELRHALRAYAIEGHGPTVLLDRLDALLCQQRPGWTATLCLLLVEPGGRWLEVANAGHPPPLLLSAQGLASSPTRHGTLLGMGTRHPDPVRCEIAPGTRILLFTDGLIEDRGTDFDEALEKLEHTAAAGPHDPGELCDHLLDAFGRGRADDVVLLAARLRDGGV